MVDTGIRVVLITTLITYCYLVFLNVQVSASKVLKSSGSTFTAPWQMKLVQEYSFSSTHSNYMEYHPRTSIVGLNNMLTEDETKQDEGWTLAAIDYYPSDDILQNNNNSNNNTGNCMCVPSFVEPLVFIVNFENMTAGVNHLNLSQELVLGIYNGTIKVWSHPDIKALNPTLALPEEEIEVIFREGNSGTTHVLSSFFSSFSSEWKNTYGISANIPFQSILHHSGPDVIPIKSNIEMLKAVSFIENSIGYVSLSVLGATVLPIAADPVYPVHLQNRKNQFIRPSQQSAMVAMINSRSATDKTLYPRGDKSNIPSVDQLSLHNVDASGAYPAVTYSYWCFQRHHPKAARGEALRMFLLDSLSLSTDKSKFSPALNISLASLPSQLSAIVRNSIDQQLTCGTTKHLCKESVSDLGSRVFLPLIISLSLVAALALILIIAGSIFFAYQRAQHRKLFYSSKMLKKKSKKKRGHELTESLIDQDILRELNGEQRTNINPDDFTLDEQIGSGSFSEVYKGSWLGAPVAIKRFLYIDVEAQKEILDDFLKEATLMSSLHHPNIVKFYGAAKKHPHLYIVTEYCERGSLYSILRNKSISLSNRKTLNMALDVARGMTYLHGSNPPIIHRDLKSGNLLCDKSWTVKVADFGLSRVADQKRRMTLCGTAETCAPEVLSKSCIYSEKADVYSFGIVLWEMFSRKQLYPDLNFFELSQKVVHENYRPDIGELSDKVPKRAIKLMQRCWQGEPDKRPSFDEVRQELEDILRSYQQGRKSKTLKSPKVKPEAKVTDNDVFETF